MLLLTVKLLPHWKQLLQMQMLLPLNWILQLLHLKPLLQNWMLPLPN